MQQFVHEFVWQCMNFELFMHEFMHDIIKENSVTGSVVDAVATKPHVQLFVCSTWEFLHATIRA